MALIACHECGNKVSDQAVACPQCGAKPRTGMGFGSRLVIAVAVIWFTSYMIGTGSKPAESLSPSLVAEKPKADPIAEARFQKTVVVAKALKASLRNPDSVQWNLMYANDDASVICIEYRAQNGFGGMNIEQVIVAKGKVQTSNNAWNTHCANKPLNNMRTVKYAL